MRRLFKGLFRQEAVEQKDENLPKLRVGVCAMDKKAHSKPMKEILTRLGAWGEFEIVKFGDDAILNKPVEEWPRCDCLLSWFSDGFPLKKVQDYALTTRPFMVNDLQSQVREKAMHTG